MMKLHERDYTELTPDEKALWQSLRDKEVVEGEIPFTVSHFRDYPKAARHFTTLFPNNYLDIVELQEEAKLRVTVESFRKLLDSDSATELSILNFIRDNRAYFIVASLLKDYFRFGHHEAHLFPEFQLGTSYRADYLLVGLASGGWHFVFVELEAPLGKITLKDGDLGDAFRKGLAQVADWDTWLEQRYDTLSETFDKLRRVDATLPREFTRLDKTRVHYVVIAGRRSDFNDKTYRIQRKRHRDSSELVLHYDNLLDSAENVIGENSY